LPAVSSIPANLDVAKMELQGAHREPLIIVGAQGRLDCKKCKKAKWKGRGVLEQLAPRRRYDASETD
jgi:hypothetical protein